MVQHIAIWYRSVFVLVHNDVHLPYLAASAGNSSVPLLLMASKYPALTRYRKVPPDAPNEPTIGHLRTAVLAVAHKSSAAALATAIASLTRFSTSAMVR